LSRAFACNGGGEDDEVGEGRRWTTRLTARQPLARGSGGGRRERGWGWAREEKDMLIAWSIVH
jgi:hypothetical protein